MKTKAQQPISITAEEAKVVASLLRTYDQAWEDLVGMHRKNCECGLCAAFEAVGEHYHWVFKSLKAKVGLTEDK